MPSFIIRNIEPTFWARVQAKAQAEGTTVKALILRLLTQWLAAVSLILTAACAADTPLQPSAPLPEKGAPATLELNAVVATGTNGGTATVTARVLDAFGAVVVGMPVDFSASSGTFSETPAATSDKGIASTILTADPGTVTITAKVARVQTQTTVSVQPRIVTPVPPVSQPPAPLPGPPVPGPFSVSLSASTVQVGAATFFLANVGGTTPPVRVSWDFGDGGTFAGTYQGQQASTTHVYGSTGSFHATIVVSDSAGHSGSASADAQVVAGPPPTLTVTLAASPASVPAFTSTTLTATATATNGAAAASSYTIDCGDGTAPVTSASKTRTCAGYSTPGSKTATATATNGVQTSAAATTTITVTSAPIPTIKVSCGDATLPAASSCVVSATLGTTPIGASQITITDWEWGDGAKGANGTGGGFVNQSHTYVAASGTAGYTVVVTATVPNGGGPGIGSTGAVVK